MDKHYKHIDFELGTNIEDAVEFLLQYKDRGILACGTFNNTILYSDTVTLDSAYIEIMGKNKTEYDKQQIERAERIKKIELEHEKAIQELTEMWIQKGKAILTEDKWKLWSEIVPIRLNDLYKGMELGNCLDIVKILNNGTLENAKDEIEKQNHSGTSFGLVCSMVKEFCAEGAQFVEYVR